MTSSKTAQEQRRAQRQSPAIAEEQSQVEEREEPVTMLVTAAPEALLKTSLKSHRPQGQVARGEPGEEPAGQPEQPLPDRRDERRRDPALDAQDQQPLDRLEDRGRDVRTPRNPHITSREPADRSASGMTWSTRMPEAIGIDRPSKAPQKASDQDHPQLAPRPAKAPAEAERGRRTPARSSGSGR